MKEESPIEKEWRRWSTSFSSVPAFTHWERETADWRKTGRKWGRQRTRKEVNVTANRRPFQSLCVHSVTHDLPTDYWGLHAAVWPPLCRSLHPPLPPPQWTVEQRNRAKTAFMCCKECMKISMNFEICEVFGSMWPRNVSKEKFLLLILILSTTFNLILLLN